jgi:alkaline phosphatase D
MTEVDRFPLPGQRFEMDQWAGYPVARERLLRYLGEARPSNPVVLTGDIHTNWAADLAVDLPGRGRTTVATEFVGTSITSGGDGAESVRFAWLYQWQNPHIRFFNNQRGYLRVAVTPSRWQTDYRVMSAVTRQDATVRTRASFFLENGRPGLQT